MANVRRKRRTIGPVGQNPPHTYPSLFRNERDPPCHQREISATLRMLVHRITMQNRLVFGLRAQRPFRHALASKDREVASQPGRKRLSHPRANCMLFSYAGQYKCVLDLSEIGFSPRPMKFANTPFFAGEKARASGNSQNFHSFVTAAIQDMIVEVRRIAPYRVRFGTYAGLRHLTLCITLSLGFVTAHST